MTDLGKLSRRPDYTFSWVGLAICLTLFIFQVVVPQMGRMSHGFVAYYTVSRLMWQGELTARAYDDQWFSQQVMELLDQPIGEILTPTIPTVAWVALPLIGLPPQAARDTWVWLNVGFLSISLALLLVAVRRLPMAIRQSSADDGRQRSVRQLGEVAVAVLALLALITPAVWENFRLGQAFLFFLVLYALALVGLVTGRDWLLGLALGLMMMLKTVGVFLWLVPLLSGRWRALLWGGGTMLVIFLGSLPWIGWETWLAYGRAIADFSSSSSLAVTAYQTTTAFFTHLFQFDATWNPSPLINAPLLATALPLMALVGLVAVTVWLGRHAPAHLLFAAVVPLSTILLPKAEEHHFVFFLVSVAILGHDWLARQANSQVGWWESGLLAAALLLLLIPIPYKHPRLSIGALALLAYPRLYSGLLLWLLASWRMARSVKQEAPYVTRNT